MPSPELVTCAGCGCVCDDIQLAGERVVNACPLGDAWFAERRAPAPPLARVEGVQTPLEAALDAAAALLGAARAPLVTGLGDATCEAQRVAVAIADAIGATVDTGPPPLAYQEIGASTATLGEVRDRAELLVVWRADPVATHPRLFERLERGRRTLVVVDDHESATTAEADEYVELPAERAVEALWLLRALVRDVRAAGEGLPRDALAALAARLRDCRHAAVLHAAGPVPDAAGHAPPAGTDGHLEDLGIAALVRELSRHAHVVTLPLRRAANGAGAEAVLAWQTGYAGAVDLASGHPREATYGPAGADAALALGADEVPGVPTVCVHPRPAGTARVAIAPATGPGVLHRLDGVPLPLRRLGPDGRPGGAEVLEALAERLG
jgi:formylmethanofuran dehydrogenase subunit B